MAATARALAVAAVLSSQVSAAEPRYDHRGALGLLVGGGLEYEESLDFDGARTGGVRYDVDLGGSIAVGDDGDELIASARAGLGAPRVDTALIVSWRGYFGPDRIKTFLDLGGAAHFTPTFTLGPRVGFGLQYELAPTVGVFLGGEIQIAGGNGIHFSAGTFAGLQLRSYLLEGSG